MKVISKSSRSRGQALLFAVLLMVFAALLGATFVTVVSLNLNQTDRSVARSDAVTSAQAGMKFLNDQLVTDSLQGEAWRPERIAPPPDINDPSYNEYYTAFERAQGWALTYEYVGTNLTPDQKWTQLKTWKQLDSLTGYVTGGRVFVKFPDPRGKEATGPVSLLEVSYTGLQDGDDKKGFLRLTAIGRSEDNDTAFAKIVAYKPSSLSGGPLSFARYDANYDTDKNRPLVVRGGLQSGMLTISNIPESQSALKFVPGVTVAVVKGGVMQFGVVASSTVTSVTLKSALVSPMSTGAVEVRAATTLTDGLMPASFDADGDAVKGSSFETTLAPTRDAVNSSGLFVNNALYVREKLGLALNTSATTKPPGKLFVGGAYLTDGNNSDQTLNTYAINTSNAVNLINTTIPLAPPALDNRFTRYRRLTAETTPAGGGAFGWGEGVYIDNGDEIEKVGTRVLENWELQRLWQRKPFGVNALYYPASLTSTAFPKTSGSLEERGARGWINPWQFLPRGSFIELKGDDIIITRDDRSDAVAVASISQKFWNDASGAPQYGQYRMRINTSSGIRYLGPEGDESAVSTQPFNGVIFADGNVRVRGYLGNANVTIASLGTIYVEGNILRGLVNPGNPPRIALIAKRNVVVNPSLFVALPSNWRDSDVNKVLNTIALAGSVGATTLVAGSTSDNTAGLANILRIGDRVVVGGQAVTVTAISPTAGFTVTPAVSAIPALSVANVLYVDPPLRSGKEILITSLNESGLPSGAYNYDTFERFFQLPANGVTLVREARFDSPDSTYGSGKLYLTYMHGAQMRRAFSLQRLKPTAKDPSVKKTVTTTITDVQKVLDLDGDGSFDLRDVDGTPGPDGDAAETIEKLLNSFLLPYPTPVTDERWDDADSNSLLDPTGVGNVAARRLARDTKSVTSLGIPPVTSAYMSLALTTSRQLTWDNKSGAPVYTWFGGAPASNATAVESAVDGEGVNEEFYWRNSVLGIHNQTLMRATARPLTDGSTALANGWRNGIELTMDQAAQLPEYRVAAPRISTNDFTAVSSFAPIEISVQATIIARDGSFFVLPAPVMAGTKVDTNADGVVETSVDLNGDNVVDAKDVATATAYRRLNYHIEVRGNISQNLAPTVFEDYDTQADPDGKAVGATARWLDAASYPAATTNPLNTNAAFGSAVGAVSWNTVSYVADSMTADALSAIPLPVSPDLLYVG